MTDAPQDHMTDAPQDPDLPRSTIRRTIWPNLVWSIPIAALIIVAYLGVQAFANRGELITVTFRHAAGARPSDTKVLYQGAEAGQLVKISPNADGRRIDFHLRMIPAAKPGLNSNARFWLIGAEPSLADLSSLRAVVSGVAVGYAPGDDGDAATKFEGLDRAPVVLPEDRGTRYFLTARTLNSVGEGTVVLFHGQSIGKVSEVKFLGREGFRLEIFIYQPYDSLIKNGVRFWKISPLRLSFTGGGVTANLAPSSTLLSGGIDLEVETAEAGAPPSSAGSEFNLYSSHGAARQGLSGPTVRYEFEFSGAAGTLEENSPVTLLGFQIGEVESRRLEFDARSGEPRTLATAAIYPRQLMDPEAGKSAAADSQTAADPRAAADFQLRRLIRAGFRARLQQTPPLMGEEAIALVKEPHAKAADLTADEVPRFPSSAAGSDFDDLTSQASQILAKVNSVPIQEIGRDASRIVARLNELVSSPKMSESLAHLQNTLSELDRTLTDVRPQVQPLLENLKQTSAQLKQTARDARRLLDTEAEGDSDSLAEAVRQLSDTARSVRSLSDYLSRHPEAVLRGKKADR